MKLFVIHKTRNGWYVTGDDGYQTQAQVANSYVFTNLEELAKHLHHETLKLEPKPAEKKK